MQLFLLTLLGLATGALSKSAHPAKSAFRPFPSLREQHALAEKWVEARKELVPGILKK